MISNSCIDPTARRRSLSTLLNKNHAQKKSSVHPIPRVNNANEQCGIKKKSKNEHKDTYERKKRITKAKKKRSQQSKNTNNNNNNDNDNNNNNNNNNNNTNNVTMKDHSLSSFTGSEPKFVLPQIGYSSRTETDDTSDHIKYIHGPKHHIFHRQSNAFRTRGYDRIRQSSPTNMNEQDLLGKHSHLINHLYRRPAAF